MGPVGGEVATATVRVLECRKFETPDMMRWGAQDLH